MLDQAAAGDDGIGCQRDGREEESLGQCAVAEMGRHASLQQEIDVGRRAEIEFIVIIECVHFLLVVRYRVGKPVPATSMQA